MARKFIVFVLLIFSVMGAAQTYKMIDTADYLQRKEFLIKRICVICLCCR